MFDVYAISVIAFMLMALFGGHAVADYGLQSAYVAESKVRPTMASSRVVDQNGVFSWPNGVKRNPDWFVTLGAHCLIHGFLVLVSVGVCAFVLGLISGIAWLPALKTAVLLGTWLGWAETVVHFAIDEAKGQQRFSYRTDQILHYGCKMLWTAIVLEVLA